MAIQNISNLAIEDSFQGLVQHDTASKALGTALGAIISELAVTASFATTASYAINSAPQVSASYAVSASHTSYAVQAGIANSAGFATNATTALSASFSENARIATSASFATDARQADTSITASHALTSVFANSATSASYSLIAGTADSALTSTSASYALVAASVQGTIDSASVAIIANSLSPDATASYADLAGSARTADSASVAARATTLSVDATASYADLAGNARNADSASNALRAVSSSIADDIKKGIDVQFNSGSFNYISAVSASFGSIRTITGSAVILGEEYIILNSDSPTLRYAGVKVYDSGSGTTGSFEWDSLDDNWFQVDTAGQSAGMLTGVKGTIGSELYPSANTLLKGSGTHVIQDSIITDSGTLVTVGGNLTANVITANTNFAGNLVGNADTATTASHALTAVSSDTAISASHAVTAASATSASFAQNAAVAVSSSFAEDARTADSATIAVSASFSEDARTATSASFASTISRTLVQNLTIDGAANGTVDTLAIASNTASIDLTNGNFFQITLQNGVDTHLVATNIQAGQNVNLKITNNATAAGTLSFDTNDFKFADGTPFAVTATVGAVDLMSFVSFDTSNLIGTGIKAIS